MYNELVLVFQDKIYRTKYISILKTKKDKYYKVNSYMNFREDFVVEIRYIKRGKTKDAYLYYKHKDRRFQKRYERFHAETIHISKEDVMNLILQHT